MPENKKTLFQFKFPEFLFAILVIISGGMLAFSSGSFILDFESIGFSLVSSVEKGVHTVTTGVSNTVVAVHELSKLREENIMLRKKLEDYEYMQRSNAEIHNENERLKEQLGFSKTQTQKNYPAQIISRDADNLYSSIIIDKGNSNGIRKNMPVIAIQDGNIGVVGKVIDVGRYTSMIMPIYNIHCTISARIKNTRDIGLVTGLGSVDSPLEMQYIKKRVLDELHYGDMIVTSGENDNYLKDIPLGTISKITVQDYNSSLDIEIIPVINFSRLETVDVIDMTESNKESTHND